MKTWRKTGGITPFILYLGTRWRTVVNFMPQPLFSWERTTRYAQNSRLGGPRSGSEDNKKRKRRNKEEGNKISKKTKK